MPDAPFPNGKGARVVMIMPVRNEAADIGDTLASIASQDFAHERLRLFLLDGCSTDNTREIAEAWFAANTIAGGVITNPAQTIPTALNLGIRYATDDDIVVRLDGHTRYGPSYLRELITTLEDAPADVACVGGPQRPISNPQFSSRLVGTLYANPMGLGGADHRSSREKRYVSQVYLGAWRPTVLQRLNGFDEAWKANEDSELSARILQAQWRILWAPLDCDYKINRGIRKTISQWGGYGFWRAQTLRRYPQIAKPRHFAAPIALILAVALLLSPLRVLVLIGAFAYVAAVIAKRGKQDSLLMALAGAAFFPCCQAAWSIGLMRGLLRPPPPFHAALGPHLTDTWTEFDQERPANA
jgi:glycosyltransferase involved in cell wall biosynthesis